MAIDGSFSLESALVRFLARCPELQFSPNFDFLSKKGDAVTEDEVVKALVGVFLHPKYTIPLIGCFRSIAQKIVGKAVDLLRLVPNLRSNFDGGSVSKFCRATSLKEGDNVIEFYNGAGRGLDLHELACLAFCRSLELDPFLWESIVGYFQFSPPPFQRVLLGPKVSDLRVEDGTRVLLAVGVSYRLLIVKYDFFSKLLKWSCFLDLVEQCAKLDLQDSTSEVVKVIKDIRWCGLQIISLILKLSCKATENLGITDEDAFSCFLRWEEFCQDVSLESAGWYVESSKPNDSVDGSSICCHKSSLQSFGLNSGSATSSQCYVIDPQAKRQRDERSTGDPFVVTSAMKRTVEMVLLAVKQRLPVLLYGSTGSGKSALISKLSQDSGNQVLSIHMDDQIDGRTLIGSYVCTEKPGEFRWQPGSLTQAVSKGYWVVFEDIDKAPSDVRSVILPLLEGANLFATGNGQEITVAESFRIFSTISTLNLDASCISGGRNSLSVFFKVKVQPSTSEDLQSIVKEWHPSLEPLAAKLTETFERINTATLQQNGGFQSGSSASVYYQSRFSLRDLLKWCKRIAGLNFIFQGDNLSYKNRSCIYQEAVDVFAAFSTSTKNRLALMQEISRLWLWESTIPDTLYPSNKPEVQDSNPLDLGVGRVSLPRAKEKTQTTSRGKKKPFVEIRSSIHSLERIAASVNWNEPVLLVGETGTGKTTLVQDLAMRLGQKLTVLNLSQQSDVADLLGGYKPMDMKFIYNPLYKEFRDLFSESFDLQVNFKFFWELDNALKKENWERLVKGFGLGAKRFFQKVEAARSVSVGQSGKKRKKALVEDRIKAWEFFSLKVENASAHGMIFSFVEGAFITALEKGEWILLDEVNLAPPETLQRVISVLEGEHGSLCLAERGDIHYIKRHPNFRLFACMNPATDAGKRDLPFSLRSRFTEYFVDDVLDDEDLILFVRQFLGGKDSKVKNIVSFYKKSRKLAEEKLQDGANQKPQYSLRSLYRALEYTTRAEREFGFEKAIYDGFCMFFLTLLDSSSSLVMKNEILSSLLDGKIPDEVPYIKYLSNSTIEGRSDNSTKYTETKSVEERLRNLARAIWIKKYPVLLQGPTSSGKTSLVQHLAAITGHEFICRNIGSYITDATGKLVFHEGVLVKAVRNGYWIVLDELNLAPSDVLEALNRLLDDNRELFVPELQETIHAHKNFMLFATQNPPGFYGGRKMLSRAFRNRFVEIHVDEIPETDLIEILRKRQPDVTEIRSQKMIKVMRLLQKKRQTSKVFAGKHGFITPRDLFRWSDRFAQLGGRDQVDLARDGYYLLAERLRDEGEKCVVREVLEKEMGAKLVEDNLYLQEYVPSFPDGAEIPKNLQNWTKSMRRLYFLVERCYKMREPVLLVGETGVGKTTVCQLLSILLGSKLHILNCHQYTETSDFLGGFYPIRERSRLTSDFKKAIEELLMTQVFERFHLDSTVSSDIGQASATLSNLNKLIKAYKKGPILNPDVTNQDVMTLEGIILKLSEMHQKWQKMFEWLDGPLVQAMRSGDLFLVDEISLADDSVLERLNSVLETERMLSLAEKGGPDLEKIVAHEKFFLLATMNPGGDFGKKELSPALRNRFTEIWVPPIDDRGELRSIASQRLSPEFSSILDPLLNFWEWFNHLKSGRTLTVRDLLSWVDFVNVTGIKLGHVYAFLHGAFLVLLDGLSLGTETLKGNSKDVREHCWLFLLEELKDTGRFSSSLALLIEVIDNLKLVITGSSKDLDELRMTTIKLQEGYEKGPISAKFEWVTGVLIKAVERGEWIVLEDANCCNPTVLDRINSLVELSGSITINERGVVNGKPLVIQPHPNFRMFLTVNPTYGEVSRAMRNRGVEIFMMQPYWLLGESSRFSRDREGSELNDVKRFIVLSGIPFAKLVHSMAKSHIYARGEGLRSGVSITYLELSRWVQLFKQLLMNGSQPLWSLQTSWEHIYLSTLGEVVGRNAISHVKYTYLPVTELCESKLSMHPSLCLPGGWPAPLKLSDLAWNSKEAHVKTNCMYLEFLGGKYASYQLQLASSRCSMYQDSTARELVTYLRGTGMLNETMVHRGSPFLTLNSVENAEVDKALAKVEKKLLFAAKWAIEQATESDLKLYLLWFNSYCSQLQCFPQFKHFVDSIIQSMEHRIWEYMSLRYHDLASIHKVEFEKQLIPLLSFELVDAIESNDRSTYQKYFHNALNFVMQLRLTYQQWNTEKSYDYSKAHLLNKGRYLEVLQSLQKLEGEFLSKFADSSVMLIESPSFDALIQLYTDLLEDHILFWKGLKSSDSDMLLIIWRKVLKHAAKLKDFFPEAVYNLLKESGKLESSSLFHSEKSLLWVYGGHPILPSSSRIFEKQLQILELCESVWPTRARLFVHVNDPVIGVASSSSDLRSLVLEGISMSSCITGKSDSYEDEDQVVQRLDGIYQSLLQMLKETVKLKEASWSKKVLSKVTASVCCSFGDEAIGQTFGHGCWQDTYPLTDSTSFALDMKLLQDLSSIILVNREEKQLELAKVLNHLKYALTFSVNNSSRPPQMFLPHQKIFWILDLWSSVDAVNTKISSFVLEMWFRWHQSLWIYCPVSVESFLSTAVYDIQVRDIPVPDVLIHPVIIYAHEKSFDSDQFAKIKSTLEQGTGVVGSLISESSHHGLKESVDMFIEPLLRNLYPHFSSKEVGFVQGCVWLRLGILRLNLLLCCDDLDPAMKYHCKNSLLAEKISSLKLEIKVRQKSEYLAGQISTRYSHEKRSQALNKLEVEHKKLQRKIVFRSDYRKFKGLKQECDKFLERVTSDEFFQHVTSDMFCKHISCSEVSVGSVHAINLQQILDQGINWQKMATGFIEQLLSDEYREYTDFVQPVLVALYEIKLGLALILSGITQKIILSRVEMADTDMLMGSICSFMRFPRVSVPKTISIDLNSGSSEFPYNIEIPTMLNADDISHLEKLITFSSGVLSDDMISVSQLKASLHRNIVVRVAHFVANAWLMDYASFMVLDKIFNVFASRWMSMKIQSKNEEEAHSQKFKFKPRALKLESIIDLNISSLGKLFANESFLEWKEFLSKDLPIEREEDLKEQEDLDEEWSFMDDSIVNDVVNAHNQLFGSCNLVLAPGTFHVSDLDKTLSFIDSHTLGVGMIKGLGGSFLSSLDAALVPENLFRICLEHEQKFVSSDTSAHKYNFYKDSNAPKMYEMVKLLTGLQQRIHTLLIEYEDHHELQKIMNAIQMLMNIPLNTCLAKALLGLQFLINKLHTLQENGSQFAFSDQVKPIRELVFSWQKMEFNSWPALLDEVQDQCEVNAGKIWLSLYSVLRPSDAVEYEESTTHRHVQNILEDFLRLSSIGEFRRRLQLLFAFLGQITTGTNLQVYSSDCEKKNVKILYNAFGYYVQFLPGILAHMDSSRRDIEMELKKELKLCQWEHCESFLDFGKVESTRKKLKKIIKKFTVLLEQPVIVFLEQDIVKGAECLPQQVQKFLMDNVNPKIGTADAVFDLTVLNDKDRCIWYTDWIKEADSAMKNLKKLQPDRTLAFAYPQSKELCSDIAGILRQCPASLVPCPSYKEEWSAVWLTLQKIFKDAVDCCDLWKDESKIQKKRRAFSCLLNLLKSSGLSRDIFIEDEVKSWWFVHPSYDVQHVLLTQSQLPSGDSDAVLDLTSQNLVTEWKTTNEYYFSSVASVLFTHKQNGSQDPFLHQLVEIQKNQQETANKFAEQMRDLKEWISTLEKLYSDSTGSDDGSGSKISIGQNQRATFKCMWQQKQLFDSLCATSHDELLLLKTFQNTHLNNCQTVKNDVNEFLASIEKFIPVLQKSKESLDNYLLGPDRAIMTFSGSSQFFLVSKRMEQLVFQNFKVIKAFEDHLLAFHGKDADRSLVKDILLGHFVDILKKGRLMEREFSSVIINEKNVSVGTHDDDGGELNFAFCKALRATFEHIVGAMQTLGSPSNSHVHPDKLGHITSWEKIFDSSVKILSLDSLCDKLRTTILCAEKLVNHCGGRSPNALLQIEVQFEHLHFCLDILWKFGHALLKELLAMCKTVSLTIHMLANVLALYSKGSGVSSEDQEEDATGNTSQDKTGTGMGEGVGLNDVSDQITDEDQLLGTDKASEEQDAAGEVPSKNDKGIEFEEDFQADAFSVSEDSEEDANEDDEDQQLESKMGETGADSEAVDEKLFDKDEDENLNNTKEKYESGNSVRDKDPSSRELRAKEDSAATADEPGDLDLNKLDEENGETGSQDDLNDGENADDMNLDKQEAVVDPTGLEPEELNQNSDEAEPMEVDPEMHDENAENENHEEEHAISTDEIMGEAETEQTDATPESEDHEDNTEMNSELSKDELELGVPDSRRDMPNTESSTQPNGNMKASDPGDVAPELNWANSNDIHTELTPVSGLPSRNTSELDMMVSEVSNNGTNVVEQPKCQLPRQESSSDKKSEPNPFRSVGDALKDWEKKVRVSVDLQENNMEVQDEIGNEIENENADEFGYVSEYEKGTAQALGPATSEQIDKNVDGSKSNADEDLSTHKDGPVEMEIEKQKVEPQPNQSHTQALKDKTEDQMPLSGAEELSGDQSQEIHSHRDGQSMVEDVVSVKKSYFSDIKQLSELSVNDGDMGKAQDPEEISDDVMGNATAVWRRCEQTTTRLSQELAEQLRLVMEPNLASKLQGDYKTGKRINMKKVIPYIASHYRKDKIWLRRTRPNKRDYQVVIAVDDSLSMSESGCGDAAIEALVTVCRAMSQLEMGSLAVASFGKKGNIRVLHDFDQPFTGETGIKMISSLSFKQENTIADQPVVDVLKYLNTKLDEAVARARLPSGWNPLQQLILIIGDGRFHERENLRRCVRDALAKKRMVAYLVLDNSPDGSIMDHKEYSFEGGCKLVNYMDFFPFPFYIVLRNIEALPRTLADLLRQWVELMQYTRD
ncbi:hypothetical protein C1H46_000907 [Malus baccata]|uniref:Midasin n=1 Tax=Malus baccata TaxID=106549 RepID=A0A540NRA7_MALBA|nr:hypothetical protein C1H46_000907 [Malus baccata]